MTRNTLFSKGEFYHLYNRGTDKRKIFLDEKDYKRFMSLLFVCNGTSHVNLREQFSRGLSFSDLVDFNRGDNIVNIGAYCLMPNHFHLLVHEKVERGLSTFMKKLLTAYSMYFNKKYKRTGRLFEGSFKSKHIENDEYLKYLYAYIHLNPIKIIDPKWKENGIEDRKAAKNYLNSYRYSSYLDGSSFSHRLENEILNKDAFPKYFLKQKDFYEYIDYWLDFGQTLPKG